MSSILDALSKVDQADPDRTPAFQLPVTPPPPPRRARWGIALAVVAAAIGGWALRPEREAPAPIDIAAVTPAPTPPSALPSVAAPPSPPPPGLAVVPPIDPPAASAGETPWVRTTLPPPPPTLPPRDPAAADPPVPVIVPATVPPPTIPPASRGIFVAPKPEATTPPARLPDPPPGTEELAGVRISFLAYSRDPSRRTVSLTLDGGSLLTLREGQREGDLEVTRIYPDRVDVVRAGAPFTVRARN